MNCSVKQRSVNTELPASSFVAWLIPAEGQRAFCKAFDMILRRFLYYFKSRDHYRFLFSMAVSKETRYSLPNILGEQCKLVRLGSN